MIQFAEDAMQSGKLTFLWTSRQRVRIPPGFNCYGGPKDVNTILDGSTYPKRNIGRFSRPIFCKMQLVKSLDQCCHREADETLLVKHKWWILCCYCLISKNFCLHSGNRIRVFSVRRQALCHYKILCHLDCKFCLKKPMITNKTELLSK